VKTAGRDRAAEMMHTVPRGGHRGPQRTAVRETSIGMQSILVVDDERDLAEAWTTVLVQAGYRVTTVHDGSRAIDELGRHEYDAVVLDVMMPGRDGFEVLAALRGCPNRPRVLVVSGGSLAVACNFLVTAERLGADAVLEKPIRVDDLVTAVARLLGPTEAGE